MKSKKDKIIVIGLLILLICGLCVTLMFCSKKEPAGVENNPQKDAVQTLEQDVEVSEFEDYDWENNAFETEKKEKKFNASTTKDESSSSNDTTIIQDDNQLRHNEKMNSGIEVEFDSWDSE